MEALDGTRLPGRRASVGASTAAPRKRTLFPPSIVMIGASTGGPQALLEVLGGIGPALPYVPVCVTLHMPAELVPLIAAHVARTCRVPTCVATDPLPLECGTIYLGPGDRHVAFTKTNGRVEIVPKSGAPKDHCTPAINAMFVSGAAAQGSRSLAVVLSGMGTDGLAGARAIVAAGGLVLVQDKETSAVWGMPGAIAKANLAAAVLSPRGIAREIVRLVRGGDREP